MLFLTQIPWRLPIASSRHQGVQICINPSGGGGKRSKTSADRNDRVIPGSGMSQESDTIPAISGNANPGIAITCAAPEKKPPQRFNYT